MSNSSIEEPVWDTMRRAQGHENVRQQEPHGHGENGQRARRMYSTETFDDSRAGSDPFRDDKYQIRNSRYGEVLQSGNRNSGASNMRAPSIRGGGSGEDEDMSPADDWEAAYQDAQEQRQHSRSQSQLNTWEEREEEHGEEDEDEEDEEYEDYTQPRRTRHVPPTPASFAGATHLSVDPNASPGPAFKRYLPPAGRASRILDTPRIGQLARIRRAVGSEQPTSTNASDEGGAGGGTWHSATPAMMPIQIPVPMAMPDIAEVTSPMSTDMRHEESYGQPTPLPRPRYIEAPTLRLVSKYAGAKSPSVKASSLTSRKDAARSAAGSRTPRAAQHRGLPGSPSVDLNNLPTPKPAKSKLRLESHASNASTPILAADLPIAPSAKIVTGALPAAAKAASAAPPPSTKTASIAPPSPGNTADAPLPKSSKTAAKTLPLTAKTAQTPLPQSVKTVTKTVAPTTKTANMPLPSSSKAAVVPISSSPKQQGRSTNSGKVSKQHSSYAAEVQEERLESSQSGSSFKSLSDAGRVVHKSEGSSVSGQPRPPKLKEWRCGPQEVQAPLFGGNAEYGNTLRPDERIFWYDDILDKEEFEEFENDVRGTTLEMELAQFAFTKTFDEDGGRGAVFIPGTARDINHGCQGAALETFWITFAEARLVDHNKLLRFLTKYNAENEFVVVLYSIPEGEMRLIELCPLIFTYDLVSALWRKKWKAGHPFKSDVLHGEDYMIMSPERSERSSILEDAEAEPDEYEAEEEDVDDESIVGEF